MLDETVELQANCATLEETVDRVIGEEKWFCNPGRV